MQKLKQLLQQHDLVLELWWSPEDREFSCVVTEGRESLYGRTLHARSLPRLFNLIQKEFPHESDEGQVSQTS